MAKAQMYGAEAGIAQQNINVPGGMNPGYGNALMGLYGAGSQIYSNYKGAKAGNSGDVYGGSGGYDAASGTVNGLSPNFPPSLYPTKNPYMAY